MILNPTRYPRWAQRTLQALVVVITYAVGTAIYGACTYRVGEPATGEWCTFDSPHRIPMIGVKVGDTLWVDVLIKATVPCDSLPAGVERRPR